MSGGGWGLVVAVVLALAISELSELSPWLAQKLIRWAAQVRYPTRVEELSALIAERPGKLFKLVTAAGFACAALTYRVTHRKRVPVHSLTTRLWIGLGSALVAGALVIGELLLAFAIHNRIFPPDSIEFPLLIILGAIAAFATAAEILASSRLPTGWATAVVSLALFLIVAVVMDLGWEGVELELLLSAGGMAVVASVSAACTIRLGNRLRFPVMAALSTILGGGLLTLAFVWTTSVSTSSIVEGLVELLGLGFALGFSAGVGVVLWRVLHTRWLSQSAPESVSHTAT